MKTSLIIFILFIITLTSYSQTFNIKYETEGNDIPNSILEYEAGKYISVNLILSKYSADIGYGLIMKINSKGKIIKKLTIDSVNHRVNTGSINYISDNKFLITGAFDYNKLVFYEIDTNLYLLKRRELFFSDILSDFFLGSIFYKNNKLILTGYIEGNRTPVIVNINSEYEIDSIHILPPIPDSINFGSINNSLITNDNFSCYFFLLDNYHNKNIIYRLDSNFNFISSKILVPEHHLMHKMTGQFFSDSTFLVSMTKDDYFYQDREFALALFDTNLNVLDTVFYQFDNNPLSTMTAYNSLSFLNKNFIYTFSNNVITRLDSNLNICWQKFIIISDEYPTASRGCFATSDNGVIVLLQGKNDFYELDNIHITKLDSLGNYPIPTNNTPNIKISDFAVYPTPATDFINIKKGVQIKQADFVLYNFLGQKVLQHSLNQDVTTLNIDNLQKGIYVYNILINGKIVDTGKIIIE